MESNNIISLTIRVNKNLRILIKEVAETLNIPTYELAKNLLITSLAKEIEKTQEKDADKYNSFCKRYKALNEHEKVKRKVYS